MEWTFEDEDGINPTGIPGTITFELDYRYTPGYPPSWNEYHGGDPGSGPEVEFTSTVISFEPSEGSFDLTPEIGKQIARWYDDYASDNDQIIEAICEREVNWEPDYDHDY